MTSPPATPPANHVTCPGCGKLIPITETLQHQIAERVKGELREKILEHQRRLAHKEQQLAAQEQNIGRLVHEQLQAERDKLRQEALTAAKHELAVELQDKDRQIKAKDDKLRLAQDAELALRQEKRQLEEDKRALALEVTRRVDAERKTIEEATAKRVEEEHRLKDLEHQKQINDLRRQLTEANRLAGQGSQQLQGEVLELDLEASLAALFPHDRIEPVPKGIGGGDVLQHVQTKAGRRCGTILWETKRTKNWSDAWVEKLKTDQRAAKADLAILVSVVLPKDVNGFGLHHGVWIADYRFARELAAAVRVMLTEVALAKLASHTKGEKAEVVFEYLTSPVFRQRVQAMVETFVAMKKDVDEERRVYAKRWAKREKHIEGVLHNVAEIWGGLEGVIGPSLQSIPALEPGEPEAG